MERLPKHQTGKILFSWLVKKAVHCCSINNKTQTPVMTQRVMTEPEFHGQGDPLYVQETMNRE
jgi:hypothetical protein